jgi:acetyl esterase/lipase
MFRPSTPYLCLLAGFALLSPLSAADQTSSDWAASAVSKYMVFQDITYLTANNFDLKLDIHKRMDLKGPQPTLLYIHGGGWGGGSRSAIESLMMPWYEMGYNVVNVEYRLAKVSPAPAAVEDCLCALKWVASHAQNYGFDVNRIVLSGESSGGHLALTTGMIPASAGLDRECAGMPGGDALPKVAAIVDFYGITDVNDLLEGPNQKTYAVSWLGSATNREEIAKRVSPLTYVRAGLPPILSIQGDADPIVPYSHSVRLQEALEKAGSPHKLITVPGGKHGNFTGPEYIKVYNGIREFLGSYNLLPPK